MSPTADPDLVAAGARLLAIHFADIAGISRVKVVPTRRAASVARSGVGWSDVWAVVTVDDHFAFVPPFDTPAGDARLLPDLAAARALDFMPGWAWAPASLWNQDLTPWATCPRQALVRVEERLAAAGLEVQTTFEVELTLLRDGEPATGGPGYSLRTLLELDGFALDLADALEAAGVPVEQMHPEYAPGQFEISTAPATPLVAADRLLLLRYVTREIARRHGLEVSFAPSPLVGQVGNGCHLHLSLWKDGENRMAGGSLPGGLQPEGAALIAGIREALPELMAVVTPSVASFLRTRPGHWSGAYTAWGVENREAALRFSPGTVTNRGASANVELKIVDGAANPYLALAATLCAGLDGVARGADPGAPLQLDPGTLDEAELAAHGVERLPTSLGEAAEAFAASTVLREGLGELLHTAITAVRRKEHVDHGGKGERELVELHRFAY